MSLDEARAFWVTGPARGEIRAEKLPPPGADELVVRTLFTGVSRGTEALVFLNRVPTSEHARMRAPFQAGDFPAPVKYGYANVGEVESGPMRGRRLFCLYPHQTRYVVPAHAVHWLPPSVPPGRAVLAANLETAVNGLWDAAPRLGDRIAVVGAGTVGCLVAWLASGIRGCEVELIDIDPAKAFAADALGVRFCAPEAASRDADLVFHASGRAAGLSTALELAGFEAVVVDLSWYGTERVALDLGGSFHSQRLTIRASQVGAVATAQRARWTAHRRMALVLRLLENPALDALITGESPFEALPAAMGELCESPGATLLHRIAFDGAKG
jgi:NADPH:quinone reductase-like Zn-dependent oxidoreductase